MKFPIEWSIATILGNQLEAKKCYKNALRKEEKKEINKTFLDVEMIVASEEAPEDITMEEAASPEDIDPRVTGVDCQTSSVKELKSFAVDPNDPRRLQVGKDLLEESNETLKRFIRQNLDVFSWRHEDIVRIDPKAYPNDSFPLPRIDQLVDVTSGHELLSFMDAYSGYNQIPMYPPDKDYTSFVTDKAFYCYKVMTFGLKNAGGTYQRLVNKIFAD
ncbi:Ribonuclease H [Abeliophyllum distichum]|uniref:Ribonuclease H n=1 Tax=Abeliophyllum distichum TaxID=126358 RepID=A0ABD1SD17_9LAMI